MTPLHLATWIKLQTQALAQLSVKQRLAAIRSLFYWLVVAQIALHNSAKSVRGPSHFGDIGVML
ncbi:hypothetical protein ACA40_18880 [Pseudomonas syringae pv. lapsa]|nr:hypothetical protein ACA40_18880 [Pseudomonas syringae pv. lapsa]